MVGVTGWEFVGSRDVVEDLPEAFDRVDFVDFSQVLSVILERTAGGWSFVDLGAGFKKNQSRKSARSTLEAALLRSSNQPRQYKVQPLCKGVPLFST